MQITEKELDQAYSELKNIYGGRRQDYFGVLYLEQEHKVPRKQAVNQITFGGHDYGIDGFHFDRDTGNFYLYQFKYSISPEQFKQSLHRLIDEGMARLFDAPDNDTAQNQIVQQIKASLLENQAIIKQFYFHFVFLGDAEQADKSKVLEDLRETLERKDFLIENYLNRSSHSDRHIPLVVQFKSARTGHVGKMTYVPKSRVYSLHLSDAVTRDGPGGERMYVGFVRLLDLHAIFAELKWRFFERNIRAALSPHLAVNRALKTAFERVILNDKADIPEVFAFNHNGVTVAAEAVTKVDGTYHVTSPRLLNGAQTIATFDNFLELNKRNKRLEDCAEALEKVSVLCRIITKASEDFVTTVTINNNRQTPVEPWNLRANDRIQLELCDKFKDEVGLYYERQKGAAKSLGDVDVEELEVQSGKAIEIYRLGQTFAIVDGEIEKLSRMRAVFEDDRIYAQLFCQPRLKADFRKIVLCYKAGLGAGRLVSGVREMAQGKYDFIKEGRNVLWALVCQGMLNERTINKFAEQYGKGLVMEGDFRKWILSIATKQCRLILSDLVTDQTYGEKAAEGNYSFLKSTAAFNRAMDIAYSRYKWTKMGLS